MRGEMVQTPQQQAQWEWPLHTLIDAAPDLLCVVGFDGRFKALNAAWARVLGLRPADLQSRPYLDFVHPDDRVKTADEAAKLEGGARETAFDNRHLCQDGSYRWIQWTAAPLQSSAEFLAIGRDISHVKGVEESLRTANDTLTRNVRDRSRALLAAEDQVARLARWLNEANDAIIVLALDRRIIYWNNGAERLYGWKADEVMYQSPERVLGGDPATLETAFETVLRSGTWEGELRQNARDGRAIDCFTRWTLLRDGKGTDCVVSIGSDVTEKLRLERQLLRAQRMESIGTLSAGIAHDLNNILAPILMSVELLRRQMGKGGDSTLDILESSVKRGAGLVRQILSFGRGVEGEPVTVQLRHLLAEVMNKASATLPREVHVSVELPRDLWCVAAEPLQLQQLFNNLIANAKDAMTNGGRLLVRGENIVVDELYARMNMDAVPGRFCCIHVSDTGQGMTQAVQDRIFEPFFTTKKAEGKTGLGLSTALSIVKSHRGFIHVYSEAGAGTTFKVYLPALDDAAASSGASRPSKRRARSGRVLVVDDQAAIRDLARTVLQQHGYGVVTASNGAEAVAAYAKDSFEAVIVDWSMPVMDGEQTIAALRSINPQVRILASSGMLDRPRLESIPGPAVPFLEKPYTEEHLLAELDALVEVERGEGT